MTVVFVLLAVLVIAGAFWIAVGRFDASLSPDAADLRPDKRGGEPAFDVVLRGYRMDEVDATIADLQNQIEQLTTTKTKR